MKKTLLLLTLIILLPFCKLHGQSPQLVMGPADTPNAPGDIYQPVDMESQIMFYAVGIGEYFYIVQQNGIIKTSAFEIDVNYNFVMLDIQDRVNTSGNERGLLGLELDPHFPDTPYIYVNYTGAGGTTYISRFTLNSPSIVSTADPGSELVILTIPQPYSNHNGGDLHFGPDGYLYIGTGDGGSFGDPGNRAQDPQQLLGKMLRIDVSNATEDQPYTIPPDNPFADTTDGVLDEIWAFGLRNPWRFAFDELTGDMWIGDVGQDEWEEVDFEPAGSPGGANYGWRCYEGNHPYNTSNCNSMSEYDFPVYEYAHGSNGCSITGGIVYRGCRYPLLYGRYLFMDYCSGKLWSTYQDSLGNFVTEELADYQNYNFASLHQTSDGRIFLIGRDDNTIYELEETSQFFEIHGDVTDEHCNDDANDGAIALQLGDITPAQILWSTGDTTASIDNLDQGYYEVTVTLSNGCALTNTFHVDLWLPPMPNLTYENDTLFASPGFSAYNWYLNGQLIGTTSQNENFWIPQQDGDYQVSITVSNCDAISDPLYVQGVATVELPDVKIEIFPNPFKDCFFVRLSARLPLGVTKEGNAAVQLRLYDLHGRQVLRQNLQPGTERQQICLPEGNGHSLYILELSNGKGKAFKRLLSM